MDSLNALTIPVFDNNVNSNINLVPGYSITVRLMSLPHKGQLYSHTMALLTSLPAGGLVLTNHTLFYQPLPGEYNATAPYVTMCIT